MNESRRQSVGALHQSLGFLITGGFLITSSEITTDGAVFQDFTPLPTAVYGHCMVALDGDDGEFFVGGGKAPYDGGTSRRAFIHRGNQWVEVEQMPTARSGNKSNLEMVGEMNLMFCIADLMCGPVRSSPGGKVEKIVAAGGDLLDTIEVYDISTNTWTAGVCKYKGGSHFVADIKGGREKCTIKK